MRAANPGIASERNSCGVAAHASRIDLCLSRLRRARVHLDTENKATILQALIDVIKSDAEINVLEIDFFNQVIKALRMSPAEQQGLTT